MCLNLTKAAFLFLFLTFASSAFHFDFAVSNIPALEKKEKGGEDSYFASKQLIAVADGVGGWDEHGVDPAKYSRKLTANLGKFFAESREKYLDSPKDLLVRSSLENKEIGSSTFAVLALNPRSGVLKASYIGDSSYVILRAGTGDGRLGVFHRSKEQQHGFNMPFQVGSYGDHPDEALAFEHQMNAGDFIVLATDGLFDNVFTKRICAIVELLKSKTVKEIAQALANFAFRLSTNEKYKSPFAIGAQKADFYYVGGKPDDITVIVAKVVNSQTAESESN